MSPPVGTGSRILCNVINLLMYRNVIFITPVIIVLLTEINRFLDYLMVAVVT